MAHQLEQTREPTRPTVTVFPSDRNQFVVDFGEVPVLLSRLMVDPRTADCRRTDPVWMTPDRSAHKRWEVVQVLLLALTITSTVAGVICALAAIGVLPQRQAQRQAVVIIVYHVKATDAKRHPLRKFGGHHYAQPLDNDAAIPVHDPGYSFLRAHNTTRESR